MKRTFALVVSFAFVLALPGSGVPASAIDHGQFGEAWPVAEPDLLLQIQSRLENMQASGELDRQNAAFRETMKKRVMDPLPVPGIAIAGDDRSWLFDPSITLAADMRDDKGQLVAAAGTRVNPLDYTPFGQKLIFIDGRIPEQIEWAKAQSTDDRDKIVFVGGSPFRAMKTHSRRFYFDQGGSLTGKFGIRATPALVQREGDALRVSEIVVPQGAAQ